MTITIGLEVEGFGQAHFKGSTGFGAVDRDAAPDLVELIGNPSNNREVVFNGMEMLADLAGDSIVYTHQRPASMQAGANKWRRNQRYKAIKAALQMECPLDWQGVNVMTNRAATHANFGVDWRTPPGRAVLSVLNNVGPHLSTALHGRYDVDCTDIFTPWQGWADVRRFPAPNRWWSTKEELSSYFCGINRLIRPGQSGGPSEVPDLTYGSGDMYAPYHLGTIWLLARPKVSDSGVHYIEARIIASIDPRTSQFRGIISTLADVVTEIVLRAENGLLQEDAADLFSDLRRAGFGDLFPEQLMTWDDWDATPAWSRLQTDAVVAA